MTPDERVERLLTDLKALLTEKKDTSKDLPANIFSGSHTPLQAATLFLSKKGHTTKELSRLLLRPKSVIDNALQTAKQKGPLPKPQGTHINVAAFQELRLTPGEAIVYALRKQELTNTETANALGKDSRNTWKLYDNAKKKLGGVL